jgi:hypothetical protein
VRIDDFREIWLVDVKYDRLPGECPRPTNLMAREYRSGRTVHIAQEALSLAAP